MEQHPVPQHIASYEFRLIGDMTLKQFGQLAGGVILALIIYALPITGILKWPLIVLFGFAGFAFAFLPFNERPLSDWVISFFKAIFRPTEFAWQKKAQRPEIFEPLTYQSSPGVSPAGLRVNKQALNQYLASLPYAESKNPLDQWEQNLLNEITNLFQLVHPTPHISTPSPPPVQPPVKPEPTYEPFRPVTPPPAYPLRPNPQFTQEPGRPIQPSRPVTLPQRPGRPKKPLVEAKINQQLPIPQTPTRPNIVVGMVLDQEGKILEGAFLEIRNQQGLPVRALRTNRLGQFMIATPLENGLYEIETEKEGYQFDIIKIEVKGEIIPPIEIKAK